MAKAARAALVRTTHHKLARCDTMLGTATSRRVALWCCGVTACRGDRELSRASSAPSVGFTDSNVKAPEHNCRKRKFCLAPNPLRPWPEVATQPQATTPHAKCVVETSQTSQDKTFEKNIRSTRLLLLLFDSFSHETKLSQKIFVALHFFGFSPHYNLSIFPSSRLRYYKL